MKKPFEIVQQKVAREVMHMGYECIGCYLNNKDFFVYCFERTPEVKAEYEEARRNLGLIK